MPSVASSLGSTQRHIPVVPSTQIGRYAGLFMVFPTLAALNAAVADELLNFGELGPLWADGQPMMVAPESVVPGIYRVWSYSTLHARTVVLSAGKTIELAANSNTVLATAGIPAGGTGNNGDVAVDAATGLYYLKSAGAWASQGATNAFSTFDRSRLDGLLDTIDDRLQETVGITLTVAGGQHLDVALAPVLGALRAIGEFARARVPVLTIKYGTYTMSSTTATITLESWMRVRIAGNARIAATGHTVPVLWIRNDVLPQFSQGSDSEQNSANVIDGRNGVLLIEGNKSAGGAGIRIGNGDGTWGTAYEGATNYITALSCVSGLFVTGMDAGIQFTNNNCFCIRIQSCRFTDNVRNVQTSAAAVSVNAMEQSSFVECFFNEADIANLELNGGAASTTQESGHQLGFYNCSMTFSQADNILINSASRFRIEYNGGRFENGDYIMRSTVLSPKTLLMMQNTTVAPTKRSTSKPPHLRTFFKSVTPSGAVGTDFMVKMSNVSFDMTGSAAWSDTAMSGAANTYLADPSVRVQWQNISANEVPGTMASAPSLRNQPIPHPTALLNRNPNFEESVLNGWTTSGTGTWSRDTVVFYSGAASAKLVCTAQHGAIQSELVQVRAGDTYTADCVFRVDPSTSSTFLYLIPEVEWFASDGATSLGTLTKTPDGTQSNYYNRRNDGWLRHQTGIGMATAPAGAAYMRFKLSVSGSVNAGTVVTTTVNLDLMGVSRL